MSDEQCKQCRFWKLDGELFWELKNVPGEFRYCKKAIEAWEATSWEKVDGKTVYTLKDPDQKMYVNDGSMYMANLITRSDFGCVHWERGDD